MEGYWRSSEVFFGGQSQFATHNPKYTISNPVADYVIFAAISANGKVYFAICTLLYYPH